MIFCAKLVPGHGPERREAALRLFLVSLFALALAAFGAALPAKEAASQRPSANAQALVADTTVALLNAFKREEASIRQDPTHAYAIVDEILSPHIDYDRVTRLILGKYWRQASPEQRQRFRDEFRDLQVRTYAIALLDYTDTDIRYLPTPHSSDTGRTMVRTQIPRRNGTPISVDYRLYRTDGRWKVYDVLVEGVSLLTSYRATIGAQIAARGIDGVIAQLTAKNRESVSGAR